MNWTIEKVATLAQNTAAERRGRALANINKWLFVAMSDDVIWGECKGNGSQPYQTKIILSSSQFSCTCPSRKPPCKHALGLLFLFVNQKEHFNKLAPPSHVRTWLQQHQSKKQSSSKTKTSAPTDEKAAKAKAKRWQDRLSLMQNGVSELEQWIGDLIRQGFANVNLMEVDYWDQVASKMTNAKLSGLSTQLKEISQQIRKQEDWIEQLALSLGGLYLQIQAFKKREQLPAPLLEHLYSTLGRNLRKNDVVDLNLSITDQWIVMGKKEGIDVEGRSYRRVWLKGIHKQQYALILDYAFGNKSYEQQFLIGSILQATVYYYPAQTPIRAIIKQFELLSEKDYPVFAKQSFQDFLSIYAKSIAQTPWLKQFPVHISDTLIRKEDQNYWLLDGQGSIIPMEHIKQATLWKLMALSGGDTISVFGEWDGTELTPLSVLLNQRIINL